MTKEEKIKEAWGELWNQFNDTAKKCALKHSGFISPILKNNLKQDYTYFDENMRAWRPKLLKGIENNNGWIKLNGVVNEIDNITNLELYNIDTREHYICSDKHEFIEIGRFTHYKPIVLSIPPIY